MNRYYDSSQQKFAGSVKRVSAFTQKALQIRVPQISEQIKTPNIFEQIEIPSVFDNLDEALKSVKKIISDIDWGGIKQFRGTWQFIEVYTDLGWSIPQQILSQIYYDVLSYNNEREKLEEYIVDKVSDKQFFQPFKEYMVFTLEEGKRQTFRDTLKLIDKGYYVQSALHCFAVIESLLREISISDASTLFSKRLIKHTKKEIEELDIMDEKQLDLFMLHNLFSTIEKILLPELFANTNDHPTGVSILRNELSHGMADETKINQTDCFKLLMIILSLTEVKDSLKNEEGTS